MTNLIPKHRPLLDPNRCRFLCITTFLIASCAMSQSEPNLEAVYADQAVQLVRKNDVQHAPEHILFLEPRSRADLIDITEIPAPPFRESERALKFQELLKEAGLNEVTVDEVGNVIDKRPAIRGNRVVAYSAHLDTVFPLETDLTVRQEGSRPYAHGIGDNSRGLITILTALRAMEFAELKTEADVWFIGNVGEEGLGDLRGMKQLFREGADRIHSLTAVDGGSASRIVYGGVGSHRYRVSFAGPDGHSWGAFGLANPHHAIGRAIALFDEQALPVTREGPKTSCNVGSLGGGTSVNSIPFEAWIELDMRSGNQEELIQIDAVIQSAMQQALDQENTERKTAPELSLSIERVGTRPAATGDAAQPIMQRAMTATQAFGITPDLQISSTDANLPISKGIPVITMSRGGRGGNSHSPEEWWDNNDGHISIQIGLITLLT